jgi:6-phosphogluconolactonase
MDPEIKVLPDVPDIAHEAAERIVDAADSASREGRTFSIALSGGSTPKALFELLATNLYKPRIKWPNVEVFFGDERNVPPDHADSNYRMAREALLSKVPIPGDNVYRMHGELDANEAAKQYGQMLKEKFPSTGSGSGGDGGLDLVLLGMGDDGHTASLFPGTAALGETRHRAVGNYVDKLKAWRITLTAPFINRAKDVLVLVSGASKAKRLAEVLEGPRDPQRLPIQLINPTEGRMTWLVDAAAAGMHEQ